MYIGSGLKALDKFDTIDRYLKYLIDATIIS